MPNRTSNAIQRSVNRLHEEEDGDGFDEDNIVHIRIQQWSVFDDFARRENVHWWLRFSAMASHPPDRKDKGR